jgi:hypothetical protein
VFRAVRGRFQYLTADELGDILVRTNIDPDQFANMLGVTPRSVARWLEGRYPIPAMVCSIAVLMANSRFTPRSFIKARL